MDHQVNELNHKEMNEAAGGKYVNDPATCPHNGGFRITKKPRITGRGKNDWGYHVTMQKFCVCKLCGKAFWEDQLPKK